MNRSPGTRTGHGLGLAHVGDGAELLVVVEPRVQRVQRDPRRHHGLGGRLETGRIGQRDGDAVGALGDGRLDLLRLGLGVVVGAEVLHGHAEIGAGLLGPRLGHRPEHTVVAVGDDPEDEIAGLVDLDGVTGRRGRSVTRGSG